MARSLANRYLERLKVNGNLADLSTSMGNGNAESNGIINITYWKKREGFQGQLEIWTERGRSFVIQGQAVDEFLDMMGLLNQVQKEQITLEQIKEVA